MNSTRTKIIATIGPASASVTTLTRMMHAGMRIARLNFSHGTHAEHARYIKAIRKAEKRFGAPIAIMQDLQGPKLRIGELDHPVELHKGESVTFKAEGKIRKNAEDIPVSHHYLHKDLKAGHRIFIDDGLIELHVTQVRGTSVHAKVITGGMVSSHKGMNCPDSTLSIPALTEKDIADMEFGIQHGVDFVALSFVQSLVVIEEARAEMKKFAKAAKQMIPGLVAKIESQKGVDAAEDIIEHVDGVLIARGDLAIEVSYEEVPVIQKELIDACRSIGTPVIVATQMLHSMTHHPKATRAEVSDVANAVFDHADGVMLSQETAIGDYPEATVQTMATVIQEAEGSHLKEVLFSHPGEAESVGLAIAQTITTLAYHENIHAIVIPSSHPQTIVAVNHYRPPCPIYVTCDRAERASIWLLHASVEPIMSSNTMSGYITRTHSQLKRARLLKAADSLAVVTAAKPDQIMLTIR